MGDIPRTCIRAAQIAAACESTIGHHVCSAGCLHAAAAHAVCSDGARVRECGVAVGQAHEGCQWHGRATPVVCHEVMQVLASVME
jgi:hypothetical protein